MFYDTYSNLCKSRNISPTAAAIEIGISRGSVSLWKNKGTSPGTAQLKKIADYFGVSTDYLLGTETQKENPAPKSGDGVYIDDPQLVLLARHTQKIPEEERKRILKNFQDTIDLYLQAMGLDDKE